MKKKVIGAVAATLAVVVTAGTILSHVSETAYAQESFVGIDSIIEEHGETNPFTIVELVPDHSMAKLGFFIEGSEPFYYYEKTDENGDVVESGYQSWLEHLADLKTAKERRAYMVELEARLASITTTFDTEKALEKAKDVTTALSYVPYEETYEASESAKSYTLAETLELEVDTPGYTMTSVGDGKGSFTLVDDFSLAAEDENGTRYDQNVSYYTTAPEDDNGYYYNLTFKSCEAEPAEGSEAYVVETAGAVDTEKLSTWNDIYYFADSTYVKADGPVDGVDEYYRVTFMYTKVGTQSAENGEDVSQETTGIAGEAKATDGGESSTPGQVSATDPVTEPDTEKKTENNTEKGTETETQKETETQTETETETETEIPENKITYYQIEKKSFDDTQSSMYGAVLDSEKPYVEAEDGHFVCAKTYTQVGAGKGDYSISETDSGTLNGLVKIKKVYYTGGYVNNEIFKQAVFNQSGLLDKADSSDISIQLLAMTPAEYMTYSGTTDLLYVSNSSLLVSGSGSTENYGTDNDLNDITVDMIYQQVISDAVRMPVILDYSIMSDSSLKGTGIQKLAQLLTASELDSANVARTVGDDGSITIEVSNVTEYADSDHFYVHENVLVVPAESSNVSFMNNFDELFLNDAKKSETEFQEDADQIGFGDIASTIITENTYRAVENEAVGSNTYGMFDQTISKAIATEYIISFIERREEYVNEDLRILDVEPCTINDSTKKTIEANIKKMLNYDENGTQTIEIVHMSSAEFISKVEDLCEYDMLYFGLYTDTMNTKLDSNKVARTVFNDSTMDGLVYTNVGDVRYDQYSNGVLDTEYANKADHYNLLTNRSGSTSMRSFNWGDSTDRDFVRYSGNDITSEKVTAVENFLKSGSPIVLADNFLTTGADGKTYVYDFQYDANGNKITKVNGKTANGYIDNCSRMYELVNAIKDQANVMTESAVLDSSAKKNTLIRYISLGKPKLTIKAGAKVSGQEYYNTSGSNIVFNFSIENFGSADANAKFYCYLYADYNADGRYSAAENVAANDFKITLNGATQAAKTMTDEDGNDVYYYELSPTDSTTSYRLSYDISNNYVGVLPIKLKVSQSTNSYRYDSEQLYFYKSNTTGSKVEIKVLQILPTSGYSCNMGEKITGEDGVLTESSNSTFYKLLKGLDDYDIEIHALTAEHYLQKLRANPEFLYDEGYKMLILGFQDCYVWNMSDADRVEAYQGVSDFIDAGYSVLFTHDTTSYNNNMQHAKSGWAGKALNSLIAPDVGFDRYGVYSSNLLRAGIKNLTSTSTTVYKVNDYYSLKQAKADGILTKDSYTGAELFQMIVNEATANNKDIAYKPNSDKTALVTEVHGQSSMTINGNSSGTYYNTNASSLGGTPTTTTAELINEGQILVYPFNIVDEINTNAANGKGNTITVATTHAQYFQIDMNEDLDQDGESDVTVWLSLTGNNSEYAAATRDARNNYYIYTKGNVTYSGVGHSSIDFSTNTTEIKLYINTMITAYSAALDEPKITLRQSADPNSAELSTIYVGMDSKVDAVTGTVDDGEQIDSGTERIYYTISDSNVTQGIKNISIQYYLVYDSEDDVPAEYKDSCEKLTIGETTVFAVEQNWDTYKGSKKDKETSLDNVTTGVAYAVDVPYDILKDDEDETTIWVVATTNVWKNSTSKKPTSTKTAYDYLKVQRVGLFDLD